jgi:hypothetical protein
LIDHYDWAGGREAMLRFGPADGPVVVVAMPLLEEWNRTRAFVVSILRLLAQRGIASALPDLPGQGESTAATVDARLGLWRGAFASAVASIARAGVSPGTLSIRGGALIEQTALAHNRWRLSPSTGLEVGDEFARLLSMAENARHPEYSQLRKAGMASLVPINLGPRDIAGNLVHADLIDEIYSDDPVGCEPPVRVVRLETDGRPADRKVAGRPLWRASEPDVDPLLAATLADDIAAWLSTCAA